MMDMAFDESTRPRAAKCPGAPTTAIGRRGQQTLVAIHGHLRQDMRRVVRAVESVEAGQADVGDARALINDLTMRRNYQALGVLCGNHCQTVNLHHTIEDRHMFVSLADSEPTLQPVIDRLGEEHEVIHDVLVGLDSALVRMVNDPSHLTEVAGLVRRLEAALISHLDYEEEELLEPIGRLSVHI